MESLFQQALIFIGASIIMVPIFHRFGFGTVLGYLVAGLCIGPFGLKLIHDHDDVIHFSEIGVIILLFVIGLEIRPRKLWSMRKDLVGLGGMQVFVTWLVFSLIGLAVGLSPMVALVLAFAMSFSSTAFAIQTLTSKNNFNTEFGKASFSILLMQDLVAIPALAIIPSLAVKQGHEGPNLLWLFPVFLIGLFLFSKYLIQPFFRFIARTNQREIFTATALFMVLGVALIMLEIGLSAALGTFIAGVLLADSEYRHELEANIEPFKSLFMGLFFISIGMTVSLPLIIDAPFKIIGMACGYILVKALIIYGTGRLFKLGHKNAKQMSLTIAQGGEFGFLIFTIALDANMIDRPVVEILTAIITISMALNPIMLLIDEKLQGRSNNSLPSPSYDEIKDEAAQIIIAGFGRFGQMFGRILKAQDISFVAIDHDADQVELLRKFGNKIYYGDVLRMDILEAAGIKKAKFFILAVDNLEISLEAAKLIRSHYPHVEIFARSRNRGHSFDFLDLGITHIKRETFDSSVNFVGELLVATGVPESKAKLIVERFLIHDKAMLLEQYKVRDDDEMFISKSKQGQAQLAQVFNDEKLKTYIDEK